MGNRLNYDKMAGRGYHYVSRNWFYDDSNWRPKPASKKKHKKKREKEAEGAKFNKSFAVTAENRFNNKNNNKVRNINNERTLRINRNTTSNSAVGYVNQKKKKSEYLIAVILMPEEHRKIINRKIIKEGSYLYTKEIVRGGMTLNATQFDQLIIKTEKGSFFYSFRKTDNIIREVNGYRINISVKNIKAPVPYKIDEAIYESRLFKIVKGHYGNEESSPLQNTLFEEYDTNEFSTGIQILFVIQINPKKAIKINTMISNADSYYLRFSLPASLCDSANIKNTKCMLTSGSNSFQYAATLVSITDDIEEDFYLCDFKLTMDDNPEIGKSVRYKKILSNNTGGKESIGIYILESEVSDSVRIAVGPEDSENGIRKNSLTLPDVIEKTKEKKSSDVEKKSTNTDTYQKKRKPNKPVLQIDLLDPEVRQALERYKAVDIVRELVNAGYSYYCPNVVSKVIWIVYDPHTATELGRIAKKYGCRLIISHNCPFKKYKNKKVWRMEIK